MDTENTTNLINELTNLGSEISPIGTPKTLNEVLVSELKRLCEGGILILGEDISPKVTEPEDVIAQYGIKKEDIDELKDWLLSNRELVIKANQNQYEYHSKLKKTDVPVGDPKLREKAEKMTLAYIERIKNVLTGYSPLKTHFEQLFKDYLISVDSVNRRSRANRFGKYVLLGTQAMTYLSFGKMDVELHHLISIFGHEVLGHAANFLVTDQSELPFYIRWPFFTYTSATKESIADYFEHKIFDYFKESSNLNELFKDMGAFEETFKVYMDTDLLVKYHAKISRLGIWVLSQTKMDDHQKQAEEISKYSIEPKMPTNFINHHRNNWNKATGLLLPHVVSELRYCVDVVNKALNRKIYKGNDFDKKVLEGMWTSRGLLEFLSL